jgi:hypothetical protein
MRVLTPGPFGTLPVVVFHRVHVDTKEPISLHAIVFESAEEARAKVEWISRQSHLALVGATDAAVAR